MKLSLLGGVLFVAPLVWLLLAVVEGVTETPLVPESSTWDSVPVEIPGATYLTVGGTTIVHSLRLKTRNVGRLASHSQIRFLVATYLTSPILDSGELRLLGTPCIYRTLQGAGFPNNRMLAFARGKACAPLQGTPTGEVQLTLRFSLGGRPTLWTFVPPAGTDVGDLLTIADPRAPESPAHPVLRGTLTDAYPSSRARRIRLLTYVWQISRTPRWIWAAVAICGLLMAAGIYGLAPPPESRVASPASRIFAVAAGAFCAAAALSLAYVVMVPPFQAADEPNHFVGFASFINRPGIDAESAAWARIAHFERIQFHPEEHFRPSDVGVPGIEWNDGSAPDPAARGAAVQWLWGVLAPCVRSLPAPRLLLVLRLVNAVIFSASVGLFVALIALFTRTRWPALAALPIFLLPTLPFFGMLVSNYALVVSAYLLLGAAVLIAFDDGPRSDAAGPLLGAAWIAAVLISRSAIPLAPFVAAVLAARILLGGRDRTLRSAGAFWLGFSLSVAIGIALGNSAYLQTLTGLAGNSMPPIAAAMMATTIRHPWLLVFAGAMAAGAEFEVSRIVTAAWLAPRRERWRTVTAMTARIAAVAALLVFAGALAIPYPTLHPVDQAHPPGAAAYVRNALAAGLTMFRFARPDHLTSISFWGGFGWLDALLPEALVSLLSAASGLALILLLLWIARARSVRAGVWLTCALAGYALSFGAYALSIIRFIPADLHGRYLLGLYLCLLLICWSGVPRIVDAGWTKHPRRVYVFAGISCLAVHAYSLSIILRRYF